MEDKHVIIPDFNTLFNIQVDTIWPGGVNAFYNS